MWTMKYALLRLCISDALKESVCDENSFFLKDNE